MKKLLLLSIVLSAFITSCSKSDAPTPVVLPADPNSILVRSIVEKDVNNSITSSYTFTYNGKKIDKMVDSDKTTRFIYSDSGNGNRIIESLTSFNSGVLNGVLVNSVAYSYLPDGKIDQISSFNYATSSQGVTIKNRFKFDYTTANNGYVSYINYYLDTSNLLNTEVVSEYGKVYFNGENVSKVEMKGSANLVLSRSFEIYYDSKNSPFKNVIGYQTIADYQFAITSPSKLPSKVNNITTFRKPFYNPNGVITNSFVDFYDFNYNEYNFPKKADINKQNLANNNTIIASSIFTVEYSY
jgi:hypothetical protein